MPRMAPTPSTVKKLFAYSGNACARPDCDARLVDETGTMLGKIAHICAAEKGGARYVDSMTDDQRRSFHNLIIVCPTCHDVIDDPDNSQKFSAEVLRTWKRSHEQRFQSAERQLLKTLRDTTQSSLPSYPQNLRRLLRVFDLGEPEELPEELPGVVDFIDRLKELPLEQRTFAIKLAERMRRLNVSQLDTQDVIGAFQISAYKLNQHAGLLEIHQLGDINQSITPDRYDIRLWDRKPGGNPWIEMLDFCDVTGDAVEELILDLNFDLYDE